MGVRGAIRASCHVKEMRLTLTQIHLLVKGQEAKMFSPWKKSTGSQIKHSVTAQAHGCEKVGRPDKISRVQPKTHLEKCEQKNCGEKRDLCAVMAIQQASARPYGAKRVRAPPEEGRHIGLRCGS